MTVQISDPAIRREVRARLERERESGAFPVRGYSSGTPVWACHLIAHALHVCWVLLQASR